jgi:hypothetical protein
MKTNPDSSKKKRLKSQDTPRTPPFYPRRPVWIQQQADECKRIIDEQKARLDKNGPVEPVVETITPWEVLKTLPEEERRQAIRVNDKIRKSRKLNRRNDPPDLPGKSGGYQFTLL